MEKENIVYIFTDMNEYKQQEYKELLIACDLEAIGFFKQDVKKVDFRTYIGSGKVQEISDFLREKEVTSVYIDVNLSPLQVRNLEEVFQVPMIDREELILQIFHRRATTKVAKLQIELAELKKVLPRLVGTNTQLSRQGGGKNKGTGETQLELDRRRIKARINELQKDLKDIIKERKTQRKLREKGELPLVALVGYTNAGKSTLMNQLLLAAQQKEEKQVLQKDMLFATLDTTVRKISVENHHPFLLSDTVGFVSDLPHNLVDAFKSTLEEIAHADLLIQVVDASDDHKDMHLKVSEQTLLELEVAHIPMLTVFNKCDQTKYTYPNVLEKQIFVSLKENQGVVELLGMIERELYGDMLLCHLNIPYDQGNIVTSILNHLPIEDVQHQEEGTQITLYLNASQRTRYQAFFDK